jgi:predicted DsbA family dithiol-disulfide isomerase
LEKEYDVDVEWLPYELHPDTPPEGKPLPAYVQRAHATGADERLRQMAGESGREMVFMDWMPSSRRALEASEYAREKGQHAAFHKVVFRKFYGEGRDMSEWAVLREAAEEVGLDPDEMQRETESGTYQDVVDEHIRQAQTMGITGVPAYVLGKRYLIMGAQPYAVFQQVMAELKSEANHQ